MTTQGMKLTWQTSLSHLQYPKNVHSWPRLPPNGLHHCILCRIVRFLFTRRRFTNTPLRARTAHRNRRVWHRLPVVDSTFWYRFSGCYPAALLIATRPKIDTELCAFCSTALPLCFGDVSVNLPWLATTPATGFSSDPLFELTNKSGAGVNKGTHKGGRWSK
jgi:hypothetical protein